MGALIRGGGASETGLGGAIQKIWSPMGTGDVASAPWLKEPLGQPLECDERGAPSRGV